MCSQEGLLTFRIENMWSVDIHLGRAQPPPLIVLLFSSWSIYPGGHHLPPTLVVQQWDCIKYHQIVHF